MNYTILALVTAAALIAAATFAASIPTEADAKKGVFFKEAPNFNGCLGDNPGEKDEGEPEKCDGSIQQDGGTDDEEDEE